MASELAEYEAQLEAVEKALEAVDNEDAKVELQTLKDSLMELLELSRQTMGTQNSSTTAAAADTNDDEMQRFMSEIAELNEKDTPRIPTAEELEEQLKVLRPELEAMVGEKCSAPHLHSWGAVGYHNAIICGIDNEVNVDESGALDIRLRVLYTNPTHKEMLPCKYFLEGECRFDESRCHYSHGELVSYTALKDYQAPEFTRLARNCVVLARLDDSLWHKGRVLCVNFMEQSCRVLLDGKEHKERERDFKFEDVFPIFHDDDLSSGSGSSDSEESDVGDDFEAARQASMVQQSLFTFKPTQALGEWEKYTKGIGSKLMAKMGYIHGTGLGSDGRGIVVPVSAQILPQGRSLDYCMEIREAANGEKDLFSVEKKLRREQLKQEKLNAKAYEREAQRVDVFTFLNENVLAGGGGGTNGKNGKSQEPSSSKTKSKTLQEHSNKSLNVESVRIADEIKRKMREINKVEESIKRNENNGQMRKLLQAQLSSRNQELSALKNDEKSLSKEQATRKTKGKLTVF